MKCPHMHLSREDDYYTCDDCGFELVAVQRRWGDWAAGREVDGRWVYDDDAEPEGHDVPSKF